MNATRTSLEDRVTALEDRVAALERTVAGLGQHVATRRLAVLDDGGMERVVVAVVGAAAELRVQLADRSAEVVLYADSGGLPGAGAAVGMQLRALGDAVAELDASIGSDGRWRATLVRSTAGPLTEVPAPRPPPPAAPRPPPRAPGPNDSPRRCY